MLVYSPSNTPRCCGYGLRSLAMSVSQGERFDRCVRPVSSQRASNRKTDVAQPRVCLRVVLLTESLLSSRSVAGTTDTPFFQPDETIFG